jgi:hypothetical protein
VKILTHIIILFFDGVWQKEMKELKQQFTINCRVRETRVKDLNNDGRIDGNNDRARF